MSYIDLVCAQGENGESVETGSIGNGPADTADGNAGTDYRRAAICPVDRSFQCSPVTDLQGHFNQLFMSGNAAGNTAAGIGCRVFGGNREIT